MDDTEFHNDWLGMVGDLQVGLVVSASALVAAGVYVDRNRLASDQDTLIDLLTGAPSAASASPPDEDEETSTLKARKQRREALQRTRRPFINGFRRLALELLAWPEEALISAAGDPRFGTFLPEYNDTIEATWALVSLFEPVTPLLLVREEALGTDLDAPIDTQGWAASPQARFERLLRERKIPTGLLFNGEQLRLVHAPGGEASGHLTFPLAALAEVGNRPMLGGLVTLLHQDRLFIGPDSQRLHDLLVQSRKAQNEVSEQLAEQVLLALYALVRGWQAASEADPRRFGLVLDRLLRESPAQVYGGLLTTLMRLVFVLYAEDRGLMPGSEAYATSYSVTGLFAQLREDAVHHPDTMHQRHGAWGRLLALFRLIHDGSAHEGLALPARHGKLFDPDAYPFLEGRTITRSQGQSHPIPLLSDGTLHEVLSLLLYLRGQRLSYRTLDVEQIGSVYENMMGFQVEVAHGHSLAIAPAHVVVDLDATLKQTPDQRAKSLKDAGSKLTGAALTAWKAARSIEQLRAALGNRVSPRTPHLLAPGAFYLQPGEERRRSGSHYTPRELTRPIVATTLDPIVAQLGPAPTGDQLLALRVCDPAMGSGAFLVETCRYLALALVRAWEAHPGTMPAIPPDEDPELHARRLVAQRCLYGVDRNPFAVDLAKLSLWLFTLAREHPFTFLDHALRHGDSLVGLDLEQIASAEWELSPRLRLFVRPLLVKGLREALRHRATIHALGDSDDDGAKARENHEARDAVAPLEAIANLVLLAFFSADKDRARKNRLITLRDTVIQPYLDGKLSLTDLRHHAEALQAEHGIHAFHWPLAFPEVFPPDPEDSTDRKPVRGFDAIVGNPPFLGGSTISTNYGKTYLEWLLTIHAESHGNGDLVAHFFRRAFNLLRPGGTFGLIATNTIAQGDTRSTGLRWIRKHGGVIYNATRRHKWPGTAAVIVSVVHVRKSCGEAPDTTVILDGRSTSLITAFLFHQGPDVDPKPLTDNAGKGFLGAKIYGNGFTFDDTNPQEATSLEEMRRLIAKDTRNQERVFPYIGGEELNSSPTQTHHRYVINFGQMSEDEARNWPELIDIVEKKVRPERNKLADNPDGRRRKKFWWQWGRSTPALDEATRSLKHVLACSRHQPHWLVSRVPVGLVFSEATVVFAIGNNPDIAVLQSRVHEAWTRFFGSSMKDDLRYTPSDCFETFPFPAGWQTNAALEDAGREYHDFRASLMADEAVRAKLMGGLPPEGLTKTYNRFHDEECELPGIVRLRELHARMDRAVLDAYGWKDVPTECAFIAEPGEEDEEDAKKRYRWPDEVRDDVLARLLELNGERAAEERPPGEQAGPVAGKATRGASRKKAPAETAEAAVAPKKSARGRKKARPEVQDEPYGSMFEKPRFGAEEMAACKTFIIQTLNRYGLPRQIGEALTPVIMDAHSVAYTSGGDDRGELGMLTMQHGWAIRETDLETVPTLIAGVLAPAGVTLATYLANASNPQIALTGALLSSVAACCKLWFSFSKKRVKVDPEQLFILHMLKTLNGGKGASAEDIADQFLDRSSSTVARVQGQLDKLKSMTVESGSTGVPLAFTDGASGLWRTDC